MLLKFEFVAIRSINTTYNPRSPSIMDYCGYRLSPGSYYDFGAPSQAGPGLTDGKVFVAIIPHSRRQPAAPFSIQLFCGERNKLIYQVTISPGDPSTRTIAFGRDPPTSTVPPNLISPSDTNVVVRIVKTTHTFETYVNGCYIQPTRACKIAVDDDTRITGASFNVWNMEGSLYEIWDLCVFHSSSPEWMPHIQTFAKHMQQPARYINESISSTGRLKAEQRKSKAIMAEMARCLTPDLKGVREREAAVQEREEAVQEREEEIREREESLKIAEHVAANERERLAKLRESLDEMGKSFDVSTGGDGSDVPKRASTASARTSIRESIQEPYSNSSRGLGVHPPDAEYAKLSSTIAWPRAVKHVLGAGPLDAIQIRHDQLMSSWVVSRGDNISPEAYDYLIYSQWVGWPKVVLEASSEDELARVRARCEEVMKVLL